MAFIKKQKLVEEVKEEPVEVITESVEDNLQSALLEVVADELNYVAKLNRMIELAEEAGKEDLVEALNRLSNAVQSKKRSSASQNMINGLDVWSMPHWRAIPAPPFSGVSRYWIG